MGSFAFDLEEALTSERVALRRGPRAMVYRIWAPSCRPFEGLDWFAMEIYIAGPIILAGVVSIPYFLFTFVKRRTENEDAQVYPCRLLLL